MPTRKTKHMSKPWYQSLTINSAIATGLAVLASPAVASILPAKVSAGIAVGTSVLTAIGMRRAIPNPPQ